MADAPVRTTTPTIAPTPDPERRLDPIWICPNQQDGVTKEVRRVI